MYFVMIKLHIQEFLSFLTRYGNSVHLMFILMFVVHLFVLKAYIPMIVKFPFKLKN